MDDRALVAAMVRRDPAGLDGVYRRYADRLYAYCVMVLRDGDAAADAVQETFLLAMQRAAQLRDPDRLRPWLYAIARNECLRLTRARRRSTSLDEAGDVEAETVDAGADVHARQLREIIGAASASLSASDREVIDLSVRHGLDAAEVGAVLGVSSNHAHARMSRARGQLQRALGALLVARSTVDCPTLRELRQGWGGQLTPLLRKRISRHIDECVACTAQQREQLQPTALLPAYAGLVFVAAPALVRSPPSAAPSTAPSTVVRLDQDGFPKQADAASPWPRRATAAALLMLLLLAGGGVALTRADDELPLTAGPTQPPGSAAVGGAPDLGLQAPPTGEPTPEATPETKPQTKPQTTPERPVPPPATSGPLVLVIAFTAVPAGTVTCTLPPPAQVYRLTVSVAANSTLDIATLAWKTTGTTNRRSAQPDGATATWTLPGFSAQTLTWWVELTSTDGRSYTSPPKTNHNPCLQPAG